MKKYFLNILSAIILFTSLIFPQQFSPGSPEWLVDKFFRAESFSEKANYYAGGMLNEVGKPSIGEELEGKAEVLFHQIKSTNNKCAFAVEVKLNDEVIDFYFYLIKIGNDWKIDAVRRFLLPSFVYVVYDSLSRLQNLSGKDSTLFLSLRLFLMNDAELKKFVINNSEDLNRLVGHFNQKEIQEVNKLLATLGCSAVFLDENFSGCVFIQISSIGKMENGFIYTNESAQLPNISSDGFVFIEEVSEGWFVYRIM